MDQEEKLQQAWLQMIETGCYNEFPQEFFKAIDALFEADAISLDARDELISRYSERSKEQD